MADGDKHQGGGAAANNGLMLAMLVAVGSYFIAHQAPLDTTRPPAMEVPLFEKSGHQDIVSRLWQDPFAAGAQLDEKKTECEPAKPETRDLRHCTSPLFDASGKRIADLVIGVMVPGAPYVDIAETRRRLRYAVTSALQAENFLPEDAQRIGYFRPEANPKTDATSPSPLPLPEVVPFELWFQATTVFGSRRNVLILWIDEDVLTRTKMPFAQVLRLIDIVRRPTVKPPSLPAAPQQQPLPFNVIGPSSSELLFKMVLEGDVRRCGDTPVEDKPKNRTRRHIVIDTQPISCAENDISFYAYGATYGGKKFGESLNQTDIAKLFKEKHKVGFLRTISSNDVLAKAIVDDLKRRCIEPGKITHRDRCLDPVLGGRAGSPKKQHLALIYERDTVYGNDILSTFQNRFITSIDGEPDKGCAVTDNSENCGWIHRLAYLRGLDGALPPTGFKAKQEAKAGVAPSERTQDSSSAAKPSKDSPYLERPFGPGQFDYLRRMAERLKKEDEEARRNGDAGIRAIGILGDDVIDKLAVLRAFHPMFPEAVFFTTDWDAALTMPDELAWTRNLLVASSFGPELDKSIQGDAPPFRSNYQSSIFLSTRLALEERVSDGCDPKKNPDSKCPPPVVDRSQIEAGLKSPRLFEIERSGAVLSLQTEKQDSAEAPGASATLPLHPKIEGIHPQISKEAQWGWGGLALIPALLLAATGLGLFRTGKAAKSSTLVFGLALIFLLESIVLLCWDWFAPWVTTDGTNDGLGEPIALLAGVSVWPTIYLVTVATILSICLIIDAWRELGDNIDEIREDMKLKTPAVAVDGKSATKDIKEAWKKYEDLNDPWARFIRVLVLTSIMIGVYYALCTIYSSPNPPTRGDHILTSCIWPLVIWVMTFFLVFLVFIVFDSTFWCLHFVNILRRHPSKWPDETHTKYGKELEFHDPPLLEEWIDLSFIAKRTKCISKLIYYPSAILAIAIISRSTAFANYPPSPPIIITQALGFIGVFGCAMMLCFAAEKARQTTKKKLKEGISKVQTAESPSVKTEQLKTLLQLVDELDEGAFVPLWHQPPIRALLLPISGIGWSALLEYRLLPGL